ncbi:MAG: 4a-hydroxytetrahydrobiopterin dehydratase [Balneolaceae bacterium]|jgi:4a-hydroxytetrahydrobiopterin dehydratase|nr:MAG: 4a-hydroxytetrahydrobiopterin dehydratase [Balneolaceae bacterium]
MKALSAEEIQAKLKELDGWSFSGDKIHKDFVFDNFKEALAFMVKVGFEAEAQAHHPEWFNVYNKVSISLSTHDAGGKVTEKDFKLAKAVDKAVS